MFEESSTALDGSSAIPHYVRITSGGKVKNWVQFCLKFFEENPERPIVLHTLPPKLHVTEPLEPIDASTGNSDIESEHKVIEEPLNDSSHPEKSRISQAKSPPSTSSIPRLISVVEIIKREYFKSLPPERSGLYQYNHLGYLEEDEKSSRKGTPLEEKSRASYISAVLEGKNFLKQERTPYMSITLSTAPIPELEGNQTRQDPKVKKLSKSAKSRMKRRLKKEKGGHETTAQRSDAMSVDGPKSE